jgi:hypothetical protein
MAAASGVQPFSGEEKVPNGTRPSSEGVNLGNFAARHRWTSFTD